MKIGVIFGNPETTTGGNALKFYSSLRVEVRKGGKIESGTGDAKEAFGNSMRIKVVKNKVAPPFRTAEVDIMFNEGISKISDLLEVAVKYEVVQKAGAFYSFGEIKLGQGKQKAIAFLKEDKKMTKEIDSLLRKKFEKK